MTAKANGLSCSRRSVVTGLAGTAAALAMPSVPGAAASAIRIGAAEIRVVSDGHLVLPRSLVILEKPEEVDRFFHESGAEPSAALLSSPTHPTLIRVGGELILIDAGAGPHFQATAGRLSENLGAMGVDPAGVTKVIFTHAHADHLWGVLDEFDELRFPKASYVISAAEWDFWTEPDTPSRVPDVLKGMALGSARILKRLEDRIERRRPGEAIGPGLSFIATAGHTPGHAAVLVENGSEQLIVGGDVLSHPLIAFGRPDWQSGTDYDREAAALTRKALLDRLATERSLLIGYHLPWPAAGRVERAGPAYRFVPV